MSPAEKQPWRSVRSLSRVFIPFVLLPYLVSATAQDTPLTGIVEEGAQRNEERQAAQAQVDATNEETRRLIDDYRAELKIVEGLETYIEMLDQQLVAQDDEISTLQSSIADVAVIERQILPLMARMIDGLEQFVRLDVPFLPEERTQRVADLRELLRRSDVTVAEKSRRVFEAFQIESEYGRTIEAYRSELMLDGTSLNVDFLRIGRVALMYRSVGGEELGYWDVSANSWRPLPNSPYRRLMEQGLKVARQEIAPELLTIPLNTANVGALP